MSRFPYELEKKDGNFVYPDPLLPPPQPPSNPPSSSLSRFNPALLLVIILLTVIFFISGLVHLLLRFFIKRPSSSSSSPLYQSNRFPETSTSHALQRQLRQLFRLHDSGLDQALIDALPVFYYKDIIMGSKEPFDCAVCLCEFSGQDELRLLPGCSHAFHIDCIDTWLLSNSTCPLCRRTLLSSDLFMENPMLNLDDPVEISSGFPSNGQNRLLSNHKALTKEESFSGKRVFSVRLGKFRSLNGGVESGEGPRVGETSSCSLDDRRCYSMGTFQYVVGDSNLQVVKLVKEDVHGGKFSVNGDLDGKKISGRQKGESFSVSKIWLWSKNTRFPSCSDTDISVPTSLNVSFPISNNENQTSHIV